MVNYTKSNYSVAPLHSNFMTMQSQKHLLESSPTNVSIYYPSPNVGFSSKFSLISKSPVKFLIMDAPRQTNLHLYIREFHKHGVTDVVRVCEPTYNGKVELQNAGIQLHDMIYPDGTFPPEQILDSWLDLVYFRFFQKKIKNVDDSSRSYEFSSNHSYHNAVNSLSAPSGIPTNASVVAPLPQKAIAIHCVAGLGRSPVLVAIALIEFAGMEPLDAVTFVRQQRRGSINEKQLLYLENYKRKYVKYAITNSCACSIM